MSKKNYFEFFSSTSNTVLLNASIESKEFGLKKFTPECILLGILKENTSHSANFLKEQNVDYADLKNMMEELYEIKETQTKKKEKAYIPIEGNRNSELVIAKAFEYSQKFKMESIEPDLFLLAIIESPGKDLNTILECFNLDYIDLFVELIQYLNSFNKNIGNYYRFDNAKKIDREFKKPTNIVENEPKSKVKKKPKLIKESKALKNFNNQFMKRANLLKEIYNFKTVDNSFEKDLDEPKYNAGEEGKMTKKEYVNFLVENTKLILIEKSSIDKKNLVKDRNVEEEVKKLFENEYEDQNLPDSDQTDSRPQKRDKYGKTYKENTPPEAYDPRYDGNLPADEQAKYDADLYDDEYDDSDQTDSRPQKRDKYGKTYKENTPPELYDPRYDGNLPADEQAKYDADLYDDEYDDEYDDSDQTDSRPQKRDKYGNKTYKENTPLEAYDPRYDGNLPADEQAKYDAEYDDSDQTDSRPQKRDKYGNKTYKENTPPEAYDPRYDGNLPAHEQAKYDAEYDDSDQTDSRPQKRDKYGNKTYKENTPPEAYDPRYDGNLPADEQAKYDADLYDDEYDDDLTDSKKINSKQTDSKQTDSRPQKRDKYGKTYKENTPPELYDPRYDGNLPAEEQAKYDADLYDDEYDDDLTDSKKINSKQTDSKQTDSRPQKRDKYGKTYKENTPPEAYDPRYDGNLPAEEQAKYDADLYDDDEYDDQPRSALNEYAIDLNDMAFRRQLDPVVGRVVEIERLMQILVRRRKNNAILIGEPGVGKTAVVEGLALRIVAKQVSELLFYKRIMTLELSALLAGTKYRGEFEERLKNIIKEVKDNSQIILFIDEIHTIIGAGGGEGGNNDAAQILKPALARGEFQCIGATTITEYEKFFKKDAALDRRFQIVLVPEPSIEDSINIISGLRIKYEEHHGVLITDDALMGAVNLSAQFIADRFLPDKALDLIDEACANLRLYNIPKDVRLQKYADELKIILYHKLNCIREQDYLKADTFHKAEIEKRKLIKSVTELLKPDKKNKKDRNTLSVTANDIATLVSLWSGIPVNDISEKESQTLIDLESILHTRVIGQNVAISAIARAIRRSRVGLKSLTRPIASFIFAGPTGVGKTELAKALAFFVFGSENAMVRLDMSEYMERFNLSKLIGSPPGYVGYSEGGILTEAVRKKPYTLVLFDELEKAHLDIYNLLLQILEDGRLTDSQGKLINFKNTIIILTSNLGAKAIDKIQKQFGPEEYRNDKQTELMYIEMSKSVKDELKEKFRPEFLNRLDDIIIFEPLTQQNIREITELMINAICKRTENKMGISLIVDDNVKLKLAREGYDPEYGARPLRRAITSLFEDQFATILLKDNYQKGTILKVILDSSRNISFVYHEKKKIENSTIIEIIKEGLINELNSSEDLDNLKKINDRNTFYE